FPWQKFLVQRIGKLRQDVVWSAPSTPLACRSDEVLIFSHSDKFPRLSLQLIS
ncbi:hypothetical protein ABZP36_034642, partial [Zizania latifolia]